MIELLKRLFRFSTIGPALVRFYLLPHVKLHYIHSSDADFHTHPWDGISIIFGYREEHCPGKPVTRCFINRVYAFKPHKVTIIRPVWTLFIHWRRVNENWYYGSEHAPWQGSDQERQQHGEEETPPTA